MKKISFAVLLISQLAACGSMVEHPSPALPALPAQWQQRVASPAPAAEAWWEVFADAQLNALMQRARVANFDVAQAASRMEQARLQTALADRDHWPTASGGLGANMSRPLGSTSQSSAQIGGVTYNFATGPTSSRSYSANVQLSYEVDLWSRIASSRAAARDTELASQFDLDYARFLVTTDVARRYWKIAVLDRKLVFRRTTLDAGSELLRIVAVRRSAGKATAEEVMAQEDVLRQAQAEIDSLQTERRSEQNALALLLGGTPEEFALTDATLPARPLPIAAAGLPAELLDRRPDMRSKRLRLDATLQQLNIAEAARYPTFGLSAGVNTSSQALKDILTNPMGSLGSNLALPFLDAQRLANARDQRKLDVDLAAADFRDKLYAALGEVELALARQPDNARGVERAQSSLEKSRRTENMMQVRLEVGAKARSDMLSEQNSTRSAEVALLQARQAELDDWVLLRKALGGF
ncbi:MAG: efflux transporter outer membrane subunit [Betaproteobacteria bacterium]